MTPPRPLLRTLVAAVGPSVTPAAPRTRPAVSPGVVDVPDPDDASLVDPTPDYDDAEFGIYSEGLDRLSRWSPAS